MPNHVTNIIKSSQCVIDALKGEKELVDFNSIIPMPEGLIDIQENGDAGIVKLLTGELKLSKSGVDFISGLTLSNVIRELESGGIKNMDNSRFANFIAMLDAVRKHGFSSWYGFASEKWGTKWNAYDIEIVDGGIKFETAWSAPHPVIKALAERFPDVCIEHLWADEDIGSNLGHRRYCNGEFDLPIADPIDFALTLNERSREYYRKNPATGTWEYDDSKE